MPKSNYSSVIDFFISYASIIGNLSKTNSSMLIFSIASLVSIQLSFNIYLNASN